jgi:hypothetical protein
MPCGIRISQGHKYGDKLPCGRSLPISNLLIFLADLHARGERVDRVTVSHELERRGGRESVGGIGYVVSLDDDLPRLPNLESYIRILQDIATRRRIIFACQNLQGRAAIRTENLTDILMVGQELFSALPAAGQAYASFDEIPVLFLPRAAPHPRRMAERLGAKQN